MAQKNYQKFIKHFKTSGFFYAAKRGFRYWAWRIRCAKLGVDWRKFSR